jgi:hypothetical protein
MERVEGLLQPLFGALPGIDGAANPLHQPIPKKRGPGPLCSGDLARDCGERAIGLAIHLETTLHHFDPIGAAVPFPHQAHTGPQGCSRSSGRHLARCNRVQGLQGSERNIPLDPDLHRMTERALQKPDRRVAGGVRPEAAPPQGQQLRSIELEYVLDGRPGRLRHFARAEASSVDRTSMGTITLITPRSCTAPATGTGRCSTLRASNPACRPSRTDA